MLKANTYPRKKKRQKKHKQKTPKSKKTDVRSPSHHAMLRLNEKQLYLHPHSDQRCLRQTCAPAHAPHLQLPAATASLPVDWELLSQVRCTFRCRHGRVCIVRQHADRVRSLTSANGEGSVLATDERDSLDPDGVPRTSLVAAHQGHRVNSINQYPRRWGGVLVRTEEYRGNLQPFTERQMNGYNVKCEIDKRQLAFVSKRPEEEMRRCVSRQCTHSSVNKARRDAAMRVQTMHAWLCE